MASSKSAHAWKAPATRGAWTKLHSLDECGSLSGLSATRARPKRSSASALSALVFSEGDDGGTGTGSDKRSPFLQAKVSLLQRCRTGGRRRLTAPMLCRNGS
eukprot:2054970-Prymnesium_polylepis.1